MQQALYSIEGSTFGLTRVTQPTGYAGYSPSALATAVMAMPLPMLAFLGFVLVAVPLYGQLYPKQVPFLTAFRPYAGNWRFTWHIVDNKAKEKLRRCKLQLPLQN